MIIYSIKLILFSGMFSRLGLTTPFILFIVGTCASVSRYISVSSLVILLYSNYCTHCCPARTVVQFDDFTELCENNVVVLQ